MNNFIHKFLKPSLMLTGSVGTGIGIFGGITIGNRTVVVVHNKQRYLFKNLTPLICAATCAIALPSAILLSPIAIVDYITNGCAFDRIVDNIQLKYEFKFERHHQYDGNNNKYYAPSHWYITVTDK